MRGVDLNLEALNKLSGVILETYRFLKIFRLKPGSSRGIVQRWFHILGSFKNRKSLMAQLSAFFC